MNVYDFVNKVRHETIKADEICVSFDVEALFPSVPIQFTLDLLEEWLSKAEINEDKKDVYIKTARFCMYNNFCQINGKFYKTKDGMSMGNSLSPFAANLFMSNFETSLRKKGLLPRIWWRYVDDIFAVIKKGEEEKLLELLNNQYHTIKFTIEKESNGDLAFLDVLVCRREERLEFDIYRKPTNVPRFIPADSHCPEAHKQAAFNSMVFRLCKLPLNALRYMNELNYIKQTALLNGYKTELVEKLVTHHARRIKKHESTTLYVQSQQLENEKRRVSMQFAPEVTNKLKRVFAHHNIDLVFKTSNKLKNKLGSTKDKTDVGQKGGIYKIECENCELIYIGQTKRNIETRFKEHINVRRPVKSAVGEHIIEYNHCIKREGLQLVKNVTADWQLDAYESLFMHKYADQLMNTMEAPIHSPLFDLCMRTNTEVFFDAQ